MRVYTWTALLLVIVLAVFLTTGCSTKAGSGAIIGGATGAALGAAVAGDDDRLAGALIGGAAGAALGGGIGYYLDRQEKKYKQIDNVEVEKVVPADEQEAKENPAHLTLRISNEILFAKDSSALTPEGTRKIQEIANILQQDPKSHVMVKAYTSSEGDDAHNLDLSKRRTEMVRNQLIAFRIASSRITALGMGESNPIADNSTEQGRRQNRRAEIEIFPAEDIR